MNRFKTILFSLSFFLLSWVLIFTTVDICSFDKGFYKKEYAAADTAAEIGMSDKDLFRSTEALLDYLQDKRDDIVVEADVLGEKREVFNERETLHMVDVKALYQDTVKLRNIFFLIGIGIFGTGVILAGKQTLLYCRRGFKYGVGLTVLFVAMAAFYAVLDFTNFWINFHRLLFKNDLWILDPNTSIMINMFPENFFGDLVMKIITIVTAVLVLVGAVLFIPRR